MFDTGTSTGEIIGHAKVSLAARNVLPTATEVVKTINAVSIRQQRPFRAATAADDATIVFHQGQHCPMFLLH